MKTFFIFMFYCFFIFIIAAVGNRVQANNDANINPKKQKHYELLVKFKYSPKVRLIKLATNKDLKETLYSFEKDPSIEYIEENAEYNISLTPSDPFFDFQDYLNQISAPQGWTFTAGSSQIVIAVLDTGVDIDHPDLEMNIWTNVGEIPNNGIDDDNNGFIDDVHGWNFVDNDADVEPKLDSYTEIGLHHGTIVAGVAAARGGNNIGVAGVTWRSRIMSVRVLSNDGVGNAFSVARGIDYAVKNGADIINLSFVGDTRSKTLDQAIERAYRADVAVVAAAGNEVIEGISMDSTPRYPVCSDGTEGENWIIGVASVDKNDRKANFSNFGSRCIDLTAPGVGIFSTMYQNTQYADFIDAYGGLWSGTSISSPQVSGALALIKSLRQDATVDEMRNILKNNLDNIDNKNAPWEGKLGGGRLNIEKIVKAAYGISGNQSEDIKYPNKGKVHKIVVSYFKNSSPIIINSYMKQGDVDREQKIYDMLGKAIEVIKVDLNSDRKIETVITAGSGEKPWISIYNQAGHKQSSWLAYSPYFHGGVRGAVGDVDGDGNLEIVVVPQSRGGPHVRIFTTEGRIENQWFAFSSEWRGGLDIALGDVNGDGKDEIIVAAGNGSTPLVRIFNDRGVRIEQFIAYRPDFYGGVYVAAGDIDGDGRAEIITGAGPGGGPHVRVFDMKGNLKTEWFAYSKQFRGGADVAAGDIDGDGRAEIITGAGPGGGPHVRVYNNKAILKSQFFAGDRSLRDGIRVSVSK